MLTGSDFLDSILLTLQLGGGYLGLLPQHLWPTNVARATVSIMAAPGVPKQGTTTPHRPSHPLVSYTDIRKEWQKLDREG